MAAELLQDAIVTVVAAAAGAVVARRVFGFMADSRPAGSPCEKCPTGAGAHAAQQSPRPTVHPLAVIRPSRRP